MKKDVQFTNPKLNKFVASLRPWQVVAINTVLWVIAAALIWVAVEVSQ